MKQQTIHASLLIIHNVGVLIKGDSGSGKTDAILALLSQGHRLVSDDSVLLSYKQEQLIGEPPIKNCHFLHARDIGIINAPLLFGTEAVAHQSPVDFIIKLNTITKNPNIKNPNIKNPNIKNQIDTLTTSSKANCLNTPLPSLTIQQAAQRPLSLLIDIAVRSFILEKNGYNPTLDFKQWQEQLLQ